MKTKEQHIGKMEKRMQHWGTKLDTLAARADDAGTDVAIGYRHSIDELKLKYEIAQTKLNAMKDDGGDKWDTLKEDLEGAWKDLEKAFTKLTN